MTDIQQIAASAPILVKWSNDNKMLGNHSADQPDYP